MIKGYKVFNPDWTCNNFQYKVGETYFHDGELRLCSSGFHFCTKLSDCFSYYSFNPENKVAEVHCNRVLEETDGDSKRVCGEITIFRELSWQEVLDLVNSGNHNTGHHNSGNYNSGSYNSGNYNFGNCNTGDYNSGDYNSGYYNSGNFNSGSYNSGNFNSGSYNSGNYNSGRFNSGNHNSGFFNTVENITIFDKKSDMTYSELLSLIISIGIRLDSSLPYKESWLEWKKECTIEQWNKLLQLPNFDSDKFKTITGLSDDFNDHKLYT